MATNPESSNNLIIGQGVVFKGSLSVPNKATVYGTVDGDLTADEIYVGIDKKGVHYVFPVQAKGGTDKLNVVQIEQDFAVCATKFPLLVCRPIAAQFMDEGVIALFEFETGENGEETKVVRELRKIMAAWRSRRRGAGAGHPRRP